MKLFIRLVIATLILILSMLIPAIYPVVACIWLYYVISRVRVYYYRPQDIQPFNDFIIGLNDNYKNLYACVVDFTKGDDSKEFTPHDIAIAYPQVSYSKSNFEYLYDKGFLERGSRGKYVIAMGKFNLFKAQYDNKATIIREKNKKMAEKKVKMFGSK